MNKAVERHLITPEYPPQNGGVADYTMQLAARLAETGDSVHVWCPATPEAPSACPGVTVHPGDFSVSGLLSIDRKLNHYAGPRRILIQWVPHGYGFKSLNVPFCKWVWKRARISGDCIDLMVHEPYLSFGEGSWRQDAAASIHRVMMTILLHAAHRVWVSIPLWERHMRPWAFGRNLSFGWLPVPSNVPVVPDPASEAAIRRDLGQPEVLLGHFGTYGRQIRDYLDQILPVVGQNPSVSVLLMGRDSIEYRQDFTARHPDLASRIHASGQLPAADLSRQLAACDVMIQPYADGVSSRRGSTMAAIAHGKPTVTTSGKATEPVWGQSGAVLMVDFSDTEDFARQTLRLVANEPERRRMSTAAADLYRERFDISHTVAQLREAS